MDGKSSKRYSDRAFDASFREEMKKQVNKNFKTLIKTMAIIYILIVLIMSVVCLVKKAEPVTVIGSAAVILVIMLLIFIYNLIRYSGNKSKFDKGYADGTVEKNLKFSRDRDGKTNKPEYLIVIRTDDGKKIKVKGDAARPFYPHIENGDRVRYHYGFVCPVEMFDKSRENVNICVFCGKENAVSADTCEGCGKPMLI